MKKDIKEVRLIEYVLKNENQPKLKKIQPKLKKGTKMWNGVWKERETHLSAVSLKLT